MSHRIDPIRIKVTGTEPGKEGGHGVVIIATLGPPGASKDRESDTKVTLKRLDGKRDDPKESTKGFKVSSAASIVLTVLTGLFLAFRQRAHYADIPFSP